MCILLFKFVENILRIILKCFLKDIADIKTGLFAQPGKSGDLLYLQSRYFDEDGYFQGEIHPDLKQDKAYKKHLLVDGDVLFAAKGAKNFAAVYESKGYPAVASTSFFVIRLSEEKILPKYLAYYLNADPTQRLLKAQAMGTSIPSISKEVLGALKIPLPDLETQNLVVNVNLLLRKEKILIREIEALREKKIGQIIYNVIQQHNG